MQRRTRPNLEIVIHGGGVGSPSKVPNNPNKKGFRHWFRNHSNARRRSILLYSCLFVGLCLTITRTLGIRILPKPMKTAQSVTFKSNIPYPPNSIQVSAIVMNHARPNLLRHSRLLRVLVEHQTVSEVILLHSNERTIFSNDDLTHLGTNVHKIRHVDAHALNDDLGLSMRFTECTTHVTNPWVMHLDDDMELDASAVNELIFYMAQRSTRIVGHYGRTYSWWRAPQRHGYDTKDVTGRVEVVLTKVLIMEREVCAQFSKFAPLVQDMVNESLPMWNGEDIFVNLVANHYYGVTKAPYNNLAIPNLNVWEADSTEYPSDEVSVSGNMDRNRIWIVGPVLWWKAYLKAQAHTAYRGKLWYQAKKRLSELGKE